MKIKELKENEIHEINKGHRIIPAEKVIQDNRRSIDEILNQLARIYNISREDAAFALENAFKRLSGGIDPKNNVQN